MIENTTYIKCRPSQLLNLGTFLRVLILVPVLFLLDKLLCRYFPAGSAGYLPEAVIVHLLRLPVYLGLVAGAGLVWHILRVRCTRYEITSGELKVYSGILCREHEYIELYRVKDFRIERSLLYRMAGLGNLIIYTSDRTAPVLRMEAIRKPEDTYMVLRGLVELSRREKHVFEVD